MGRTSEAAEWVPKLAHANIPVALLHAVCFHLYMPDALDGQHRFADNLTLSSARMIHATYMSSKQSSVSHTPKLANDTSNAET